MSQVRKSRQQRQRELDEIRTELVCGLLPYQVAEKRSMSHAQLLRHLRQLEKQSGERLQKFDVNFLALQYEIYIENMTRLKTSCDTMIARACVDKEEEEIVEPEFIRLAMEINERIMTQHTSMVRELTNHKLAEVMKKQAAEAKDIPITKNGSHMGVS